jgi:hypothetical protein
MVAPGVFLPLLNHGFPYDISRPSVSSHPWGDPRVLVQLASSGEGHREGLEARRRSR